MPEEFVVEQEGHPFQRVLGRAKDPYLQVIEAEKVGIGTRRYELIDVETVTSAAEVEAAAGSQE